MPTPMHSAKSHPIARRCGGNSAGSSIMAGKPIKNSLKRGRTLSVAVSRWRNASSKGEGETSLSLPLRTSINAPAATIAMPANS